MTTTIKIPNYHTLLHVLPTTEMLSSDLIEDIREGESLETLKRRFTAIIENVQEMAELAPKISYIPAHIEPLLALLEKLNQYLQMCRKALVDNNYGETIIGIVSAHTKIHAVIQCVRSTETYESNTQNSESSPTAMYVF